MKIVDDHEVEEPEQITRFIFGALAGVVLALIATFSSDLSNFIALAVVFVGCMLTCGWLAVIHGDYFWSKLKDWL